MVGATQPIVQTGEVVERHRKTPSRWTLVAMVLGLALLAAAIPIAAGLFNYVGFLQSDRIAPGVFVRSLPLGEMTLGDAERAIARAYNQELMVVVTDTSDPARAWPAFPAEFGVSVDSLSIAQQALAIGRQDGLIAAPLDYYQARSGGRPLDLVTRFDPQVARAGLETWAPRLYVAPQEGAIAIENGVVVQAPGIPGKALDVEATLEVLAANTQTVLDYSVVPLVMQPIAPRTYDVSAATSEVQRLIHSDLTLQAYDPVADEWRTFAPQPDDILQWLRVQPDGAAVSVQVDEAAIDSYVAGLDGQLGSDRALDASQARTQLLSGLNGGSLNWIPIRYATRSYTVNPRDTKISIAASIGVPVWKLEEYNPPLRSRGPSAGETLTLPPRDSMLELPVVPGKRIVVSINQQRMYAYQNGGLIRTEIISTGIADSPTLPGLFQIKSHYLNAYASRWDLWMPHFLGVYDALPGFENGFHGLPLLSSGRRLWADVLGRPASFGCIILTLDGAEWLYGWADNGVVVDIQR
jgi:L,D-transpeptidase catalytic domain/Putative peptidoglycan binding domain/LysM domain